MKQATGEQKVARSATQVVEQEAGAKAQGLALVPPIYGVAAVDSQPVQRMVKGQPENRTGLPDQLKAGVEALSELSLDDVRVHYNSAKPARLEALAYTQGTEIHVGPGQERYLPHEAWHIVQQKQGRVSPTVQAKGVVINDDQRLELEADVRGEKAMTMRRDSTPLSQEHVATTNGLNHGYVTENALPSIQQQSGIGSIKRMKRVEDHFEQPGDTDKNSNGQGRYQAPNSSVIQLTGKAAFLLGGTLASAGSLLGGGEIALALAIIGGVVGFFWSDSASENEGTNDKEISEEEVKTNENKQVTEQKTTSEQPEEERELETDTNSLGQTVQSMINSVTNRLFTLKDNSHYSAQISNVENVSENLTTIRKLITNTPLHQCSKDHQFVTDAADEIQKMITNKDNQLTTKLWETKKQLEKLYEQYKHKDEKIREATDKLDETPYQNKKSKTRPIVANRRPEVRPPPPANPLFELPDTFHHRDQQEEIQRFITQKAHNDNARAVTRGAGVIIASPRNQPTGKVLTRQELGIPDDHPAPNHDFNVYHCSHGNTNAGARSVSVFWVYVDPYVKIVAVGEHLGHDSYLLSWRYDERILPANNFRPFEQ